MCPTLRCPRYAAFASHHGFGGVLPFRRQSWPRRRSVVGARRERGVEGVRAGASASNIVFVTGFAQPPLHLASTPARNRGERRAVQEPMAGPCQEEGAIADRWPATDFTNVAQPVLA